MNEIYVYILFSIFLILINTYFYIDSSFEEGFFKSLGKAFNTQKCIDIREDERKKLEKKQGYLANTMQIYNATTTINDSLDEIKESNKAHYDGVKTNYDESVNNLFKSDDALRTSALMHDFVDAEYMERTKMLSLL
jgi:predicted proteasome-type protease